MKSPGSGGAAPNQPQPQGSIAPYGQATPFSPQYTNFLPDQAGAMATGLTPEMMAATNAPPPLAINQQPQGMNPNDLKAMLAQLMARRAAAPRDTNPGASFSPFGASSNSGGGYQSMRSGPMQSPRGSR